MNRNFISLAALAVMASMTLACAFASPAFAADAVAAVPSATEVAIPWGNAVAALITGVESVLGAALLALLTFAARSLPAAIQVFITQRRIEQVEQLLEHSIDYALNLAAVAVKDQSINVNVGSKTVAVAAQYAIDHGPAALIKWAGGGDAIVEKIIARIPTVALVDEAAAALSPSVTGG